MALSQQTAITPAHGAPARRVGLRVTSWVLMILGGISTFVGLFIFFGGDDQYLGLGGEFSWRVGEIDSLWGWGLLIGGLVFLIGGLMLLFRDRQLAAAGAAESPGADLFAHTVVFALVNTALWVQDIVITGGLNYVLWVTLPWAVGLAIHAISYFVARRE